MIDQNYWKVVNKFGGGYPRPYSEFIYQTHSNKPVIQAQTVEIGEDFDTFDLRK